MTDDYNPAHDFELSWLEALAELRRRKTIPDGAPMSNRLPILEAQIDANVLRIRTATKDALEHAWLVGQDLIEAKPLVKDAGLSWGIWVTARGLSSRQAQKYMRIGKLSESEFAAKSALKAEMTIDKLLEIMIEDDSQLIQQSKSNEHYTPQDYVNAAREVMGGIDLDPASCEEANAIVAATEFYEEDGEKKVWSGNVWLNPPYGKKAGAFIEKLETEIGQGNVQEATVLVNAHCTDTKWFRYLWNGLLCFTDHRINFYGDEERSGSTHGSVFAYFGEHPDQFIREFSKFGPIVKRVEEW